ncbi:MAG: ABC transporter ATP-binding protein [Methanoregulaceae archaeon]
MVKMKDIPTPEIHAGDGDNYRDAVIEAEDLRKEFGPVSAVDGISFAIRKGEIFGFLGPNGAGKTTTMKMIQCVSPRSGGMLRVLGLDPETNAQEIKARLGVVPQETNLDPDFTCFGNLTAYARYFGIPDREARLRAEELLDFVHLREKRDVSIEKLSGGMRRRLILARALVNQPDLLILDEPTIGLDPQARHLIWEKLRSLRQLGKTIVLTTHYLDEAARLCNRLVIVDSGKILVEGSPEDLVKERAGVEIIEADSTPEMIAILAELHLEYENLGDVLQLTSANSREAIRILLDRCGPGRVRIRPATLEDVFLKLTGRRLRE